MRQMDGTNEIPTRPNNLTQPSESNPRCVTYNGNGQKWLWSDTVMSVAATRRCQG